MEILKELLPGCFLLQPKRVEDSRGFFVKTYHEGLYKALGVSLDIREEFYSVSHKGVIRGMHFQLPPHEHDKLVYCTRGAVMDVLLDLRKGQEYGRLAFVELSGENSHLVFIPKGIAHGFATLTDEALMLYKTNTVHAPEADYGIRWDSFGFDWGIAEPVISTRDQHHRLLADFVSPF
jgi:dTDP-4-dehydrorhamnose 3,5-epimerase